MGWRVTLALLVAVAVAGAVLVIDVRRTNVNSTEWSLFPDSRGEAPGAKVKHLLSFDPATISAIRLSHEGGVAGVTRTNGQWVGAAEPRLVDDFVKSLQDMAEISPLEVPAAELKDYGLDPPQSMIEIRRSNGEPIVVRLGLRNPAATGVYAQLGEKGPVSLTGAVMQWEFDKAFKAIGGGSPPTAAPAGVEIEQHAGKWESGYGENFFNIVGTLKNTSAKPARYVKLHADLLDADGQVVAGTDFYNALAEGLAREDLPADLDEKLRIVAPKSIPPGGEERFRTSFLKEETPEFKDYRLSVVTVGEE